jgi:hypothetical protein
VWPPLLSVEEIISPFHGILFPFFFQVKNHDVPGVKTFQVQLKLWWHLVRRPLPLRFKKNVSIDVYNIYVKCMYGMGIHEP